jgi:hypothetical protein
MSERAAPIAWIAWLGLVAPLLHAQSLDIYPEFRRPDPFGGIVATDKGESPREILSPAVARNGFASFHIVVSVPAKENYFLYVASNPLTACRISLYREHFVKTAEGWIPDPLVEVTHLPDFGVMPDPDQAIEGQTTRAYLLDVWIPPDADVSRFRLEVQLKMGDFTVRPMEMRVGQARFPDLDKVATGPPLGLPPIETGADAAALGVLRGYLKHDKLPAVPGPKTVRAIIQRNTIQDMALAASLPPGLSGAGVLQSRVDSLLKSDIKIMPRFYGAEWYLRLRDYLFTAH